ncbi:ribonuclease H-like domain-containing protein [Lactarius vividus]|nr:ribonuclease H-like domain-containing protein [Lactarius vividus]
MALPLTTYKSPSSELEVSLAQAGGPGGTGGTSPRAAGGSTNDSVPYDWRAFTANAQLHYIRTEDTANECIARIASRPSPLAVGLDLEWRPTFTSGRRENPIALVQLACDDEILLVQVSAMPAFPSGLRDLLESAESVKVGVGIQYDCKKLWRDHRVSVRNCVDLALLARSVDTRWKGPYGGGIGLSRLADTYLGRKLEKGRTQTSNWEAELSTQQKEYAANDCHSSVAIYRTLIQRALILERAPEREWYTFHAIGGVLRDVEGRPWFPDNPYYDPGPPPGTAQSDVVALRPE